MATQMRWALPFAAVIAAVAVALLLVRSQTPIEDPLWWFTNDAPPRLSVEGPSGPLRGPVQAFVRLDPADRTNVISISIDGRAQNPGARRLELDSSKLADGPHTVEVVARDTSRRQNQASATWSFVSDNTPPRLEMSIEPSEGPQEGRTLLIRFRLDEPTTKLETTFGDHQVRLQPDANGGYWALEGVTPGDPSASFLLRFVAIDQLGNTGVWEENLQVRRTPFAEDDLDMDPGRSKRRRAPTKTRASTDLPATEWPAALGWTVSRAGRRPDYDRVWHASELRVPPGYRLRRPDGYASCCSCRWHCRPRGATAGPRQRARAGSRRRRVHHIRALATLRRAARRASQSRPDHCACRHNWFFNRATSALGAVDRRRQCGSGRVDASRVSMSLLAAGDLNALDRADFAAALTPLFEAAAPLVNALYLERPFVSYGELIDRAEAIAAGLPEAERIAVVNAHPRIGASPTLLSAASYREQGYAAESALEAVALDATYRALAELNAQYEDRFGFRFVVWVNRRPETAIVEVLRARLAHDRAVELETGLREMFSIARDRLAAERVADPFSRRTRKGVSGAARTGRAWALAVGARVWVHRARPHSLAN